MVEDILGDLEFEQLIGGMSDRELAEFNARQIHDLGRRMRTVEGRGRKAMGAFGGIGALVGAAVVGAIDYVLRRGAS